MAVHHIPDGFHAINVSITVSDAKAAMAFYAKVFHAVESLDMRMEAPDGKIMHADIRIGDSSLMINDEYPEWGNVVPDPQHPSAVRMHLYVPDLDATVERALAAGASIVRPPSDEFYGHRAATVLDPFGHTWSLGQKTEDLTTAEMRERMNGFMTEMAGA